MYKFYMGLWWFCFIQWPLFMFLGWANNKHLYSCLTESFVCKLDTYYVMYMFFLAPYLILPIILAIVMTIRTKKKMGISRLEEALAVCSWGLSLFMSVLLIFTGGFHT